MHRIFNFLMEEAGDGKGAGGAGSLLTTPNGGGGAQAPTGNTGTPPGTTGDPASGTPNPNSAPAGNQVQDWKLGLPQELQGEPSLKMFTDVSALAKSYIHAQRAIGSEKISVPGKHATEDDWNQVYSKLGLPKEIKDYEIKIKDGVTLDAEFTNKFKENAFKAGILPAQAQKLADWFGEANLGAEAAYKAEREAKIAADHAALKTEWGQAYDQNLSRAAQVVREAADPDLLKYLDDSGLGNDTRLIKLLANVGDKFMKEGKHIGGNPSFTPKFTPAQARQEANKILADAAHPYNVKEHPNHSSAVKEVQELFEQIHPQT